jgi:hypothetical protein
MQFCHGAPGFVVCLGDMPGHELDELLLAAGRATWAAGPLAQGANLCHGTGGNGYAFPKLFKRTGDSLWLDRARALAGIWPRSSSGWPMTAHSATASWRSSTSSTSTAAML